MNKLIIITILSVFIINKNKKTSTLNERKHLPINEAKQGMINSLSKLSEDTAHLIMDPALFKAYFSAIAKDKQDDIQRMIGTIELPEQTFADVTFRDLKIEPQISSKAEIKFDKPKLEVRGLPITMDFLENNISVSFQAVSAKYEVPTEEGSVVWAAMPIQVQISLGIDPAKGDLASTPQKVFFEMPEVQKVLPSLKEKKELEPALNQLAAFIKKEIEWQIKEKFKMVLRKDVEAFVKKLNTDNVALGKVINFRIEPINAKLTEDGKVDVEYNLKDSTADAFKAIKVEDPFSL